MSLTKLSLARNHIIIPGQGELVIDIQAGDRKIDKLFDSVEKLILFRCEQKSSPAYAIRVIILLMNAETN
jgi:hypothetical protein